MAALALTYGLGLKLPRADGIASAVKWANKGTAVSLTDSDTTMSTAGTGFARGLPGHSTGRWVFPFTNAGSFFSIIGVGNASALLEEFSGLNDHNAIAYADFNGSFGYVSNGSGGGDGVTPAAGFGPILGLRGFVALDADDGFLYVKFGPYPWCGAANADPDAGTGGWDIGDLAGQMLFPYGGGEVGTSYTIDSRPADSGLTTYSDWRLA